MNPPEDTKARRERKADDETPLFARCYDFLLWLTPTLAKYPRNERFLLAQTTLETAYTCERHLVRARKLTGSARSAALVEADALVELLRMQLRQGHDLRCLDMGQYEHGSALVNEIGRMAGVWRRE